MRKSAAILSLLTVCLFPVPEAWAAECPSQPAAGWVMESLATQSTDSLNEPMHLDFDGSVAGAPDLYFVERRGVVRRYRAALKKVETLGKIVVRTGGEYGALGIALDPDFGRNRRIYVSYTEVERIDFRVSRFTLKDDVLDLKSERVLLQFPFKGEIYHSGALQFGPDGNLFIAIGSGNGGGGGNGDPRQNAQWNAADSRDFQGKILRIRPTETGYAIPDGNLFPLDRYPDTLGSKTRPEVYAMGVKQPFSLGFDPGSGRLVFGEMGPDNGGWADELNLAAGPGNFGWPYFFGINEPMEGWGIGKDPQHPVHTTPLNTGLTELPPALPATRSIRQNAPITGPVYRVAVARPGPDRLPHAFDGLWFSTDFNTGFIDTARVSLGGAVGAAGRLAGLELSRPTDLRIGPDGVLYAVNYGGWYSYTPKTSLIRIRWNDPCPAPIQTAAPGGQRLSAIHMEGARLFVPYAAHTVEIRDLSGTLKASFVGDAKAVYALDGLGLSGLAWITVRQGNSVRVIRAFSPASSD